MNWIVRSFFKVLQRLDNCLSWEPSSSFSRRGSCSHDNNRYQKSSYKNPQKSDNLFQLAPLHKARPKSLPSHTSLHPAYYISRMLAHSILYMPMSRNTARMFIPLFIARIREELGAETTPATMQAQSFFCGGVCPAFTC